MNTLYEIITTLPQSDDVKVWLTLNHLPQGGDLIGNVSGTKEERNLVAKYVSFAYDPNSETLGKHKTREEEKAAIVNSLYNSKKFPDIWIDILENNNKEVNEYIAWYYKQINDPYFEAIKSGEDMVSSLLTVARIKVEPPTGNEGKDDKFFKAMQYQSECWTRAVAMIDRIEELKTQRKRLFEKTDDTIESELKIKLKKSGFAEQGASYAQEIKNKPK